MRVSDGLCRPINGRGWVKVGGALFEWSKRITRGCTDDRDSGGGIVTPELTVAYMIVVAQYKIHVRNAFHTLYMYSMINNGHHCNVCLFLSTLANMIFFYTHTV